MLESTKKDGLTLILFGSSLQAERAPSPLRLRRHTDKKITKQIYIFDATKKNCKFYKKIIRERSNKKNNEYIINIDFTNSTFLEKYKCLILFKEDADVANLSDLKQIIASVLQQKNTAPA